MDDQLKTEKLSAALNTELEAFTNTFIEERVNSGDIDLSTIRFAEMELLSHEIGQRVARGLGGQLAERQNEALWSDNYHCTTCGLECETLRHPRTVQTRDGLAEIVELKSYCPQCRRQFFPRPAEPGNNQAVRYFCKSGRMTFLCRSLIRRIDPCAGKIAIQTGLRRLWYFKFLSVNKRIVI